MPNPARALVLPTGRCFDDALELIENRVHVGKASDRILARKNLRLVHAILVRRKDGERCAHAWVEDCGGALVTQAILLNGRREYISLPGDDFRESVSIERAVSYTVDQAWALNDQHGTYGPWDGEMLSLCLPAGAKP